MAGDVVPTVQQELVYAGRRQGSRDRIVYEYVPLEADGSLGSSLWYKGGLGTSRTIGAIIVVNRPAGQPDSVYTKGQHAPRAIGFADVPEATLLEWQVADRAAYEATARRLPSSQRAAFGRYVSDRIRGVA